jgi:hypothetical protein
MRNSKVYGKAVGFKELISQLSTKKRTRPCVNNFRMKVSVKEETLQVK